MKVKELLNIADIKLLSINYNSECEISEFYACDLLSFAMGHAKNQGTCLITIIPSMNVIALGLLLDYSAVIFPEGVIPSTEVIEKANKENLPLFSSKLSSLRIYKEILEYESKV